jgi:NDP-sugar pyrophosphorylase family protein
MCMEPFYPLDYFDLSTFEHAALFVEGEPVWSALKNIREYLLSRPLGSLLGTVSEGAYLVNPESIFIGKGTVVEPGAYIKGPCIIGENCQIRHGAYIRGDLIAGNRCVIGHATEVKNSIFFDGAQAGHFAYVGDSILGNHVNLGAGTKCANLRFDNHHIPVIWKGRRIDSGLRKFGAIFGDRAQTGCNAVTNPGTLMGKESCLGPCATFHGFIPEKTIVKAAEAVMMAAHH